MKPNMHTRASVQKQIRLFTDGSGPEHAGGPGGWAAILTYGDHHREIAGAAIGKNNVMELTALEEGLKAIKITAAHIEVITDSINLIGWMFGFDTVRRQPDSGKPFKRKDPQIRAVCERIDALVRDRGFILTFTWTKGHAGHSENERCDHLARAARDRNDLPQ